MQLRFSTKFRALLGDGQPMFGNVVFCYKLWATTLSKANSSICWGKKWMGSFG